MLVIIKGLVLYRKSRTLILYNEKKIVLYDENKTSVIGLTFLKMKFI